MKFSEIKELHTSVIDAILSDKFLKAKNYLEQINHVVQKTGISDALYELSETYQNMLKYSFEFAPDPQRPMIYNNLQKDLISIADDLKISAQNNLSRSVFTKYSDIIMPLENFTKADLSKAALEHSISNEWEESITRKWFYTYLLTNRYSENQIVLAKMFIDEEFIDWKDKAVFISSISLSLLRHFDTTKFDLLLGMLDNPDKSLSLRALIGLTIGLIVYKKRLRLYPELLLKLTSIQDDPLLQKQFLQIAIQIVRSKETEKITKKIQEEIVPEMIKIKSDLEEKLNLKDLVESHNFEDKNPDWEDFFKDSPGVYQKLEQFSKMQSEGADVFMGAFSMLKNFDFFNDLSNWLLPFDKGNQYVNDSMKNVGGISSLLNGLDEAPMLCNSDKYSFCFNLQHLPEQQRIMMNEMFASELNAMNEMIGEEKRLNPQTKDTIIINQYIQDLYRFFKLHPMRKNFEPAFQYDLDLYQDNIIDVLLEKDENYRKIAEYYFASDQYQNALDIFLKLQEKENTYELCEKIGFCYQRLGKFDLAIEHYNMADLFDVENNKIWLYQKMSYCFRKMKKYNEAIKFHENVMNEAPTDYNNLIFMGQLLIDKEDFEEALKIFFKIEYENPGLKKVYRPIAWCSFTLGRLEQALKYFEKVIAFKPVKSDYLNIGHCYWALKNTSKAIEMYKKAIQMSKHDLNWFRGAMEKDKKYLARTGKIGKLDISFMIDYIIMA